MNVTNLAFNKKKTRVVITGKPKFYNVLGTAFQYGPVLAYLFAKFDMFTFNNVGYGITGWGMTFAIIMLVAFRNKIKEKLKEYDDTLGDTWKRSKIGTVCFIIGVVLFFISYFSNNFFIIFMILSASTYTSLFLYAPYDVLLSRKKVLQKMLTEENEKEDFEILKTQYDDMKKL